MTAAIAYLGSVVTAQDKPLPGRRYEFGYDAAGNFLTSGRTGVPGTEEKFTPNKLNQYDNRENNSVAVSGTAHADAKVLVNGRTALAARRGRFWSDELTVANNLAPFTGPITILTAIKSGSTDLLKTEVRQVIVAKALQSFSYDEDGNMKGDGLWSYTWDAENRLIRMETTQEARDVNIPWRILRFRYDHLGRRIQKQVINGSNNLEISCRRYLYDGWNLVAEFDAAGGSSCGTILRSFVWGLDLTGSMTASGGVGALLQIIDHSAGKTLLATYNGNGNVAALINAASGAIEAAYEYSPFGELVRCDGLYAKANPFRFSTKFTDDDTGLVYYGNRYYSPSLGRFINRDPIEEQGGINLYGFCGNNPVNRWDLLGQMWFSGFFSSFFDSVSGFFSRIFDGGISRGVDLSRDTNVPTNIRRGGALSDINDGTKVTAGACGKWSYGANGWGYYAPEEKTWDPSAILPVPLATDRPSSDGKNGGAQLLDTNTGERNSPDGNKQQGNGKVAQERLIASLNGSARAKAILGMGNINWSPSLSGEQSGAFWDDDKKTVYYSPDKALNVLVGEVAHELGHAEELFLNINQSDFSMSRGDFVYISCNNEGYAENIRNEIFTELGSSVMERPSSNGLWQNTPISGRQGVMTNLFLTGALTVNGQTYAERYGNQWDKEH